MLRTSSRSLPASVCDTIDRSQSQVGSRSQILLCVLITGRTRGCFPDETTSPPRFYGPREPRQRQGEGEGIGTQVSRCFPCHGPNLASPASPAAWFGRARCCFQAEDSNLRSVRRHSLVKQDKRHVLPGSPTPLPFHPAAAAGRKHSLPAVAVGCMMSHGDRFQILFLEAMRGKAKSSLQLEGP